MKKILVIGVNSYIGNNFYQYVSTYYKESISVELISGSNGEWQNVEFSNYDIVLHLSAIVHQKESPKIIDIYDKVNHIMAVDIANKAKNSGVKQFIFMSSAAVYGDGVTYITKDTVPNPTTYYGKSKLAAEEEIIKLQTKEFRVAILRPPMVYGEGCKGNYAKLVKLARYTPVFPRIHNKRSMIHILILVKFIIKIIKDENGGYYHPQDKKYVDTCEMIVEIRKEIGKKTYLIGGFDLSIHFLSKYISSINKMFTDFYYDTHLE